MNRNLLLLLAVSGTLHAVQPVQIIGPDDNQLHMSEAQLEALQPGSKQRLADKRAALAARLSAAGGRCAERVAAYKTAAGPQAVAKWHSEGIHLCDVIDGRPVFEGDDNSDAAIGAATDQVRDQSAFLGVRGQGFSVGVWETGLGTSTSQLHNEWRDRYSFRDPNPLLVDSSGHAARVIGTIAAEGSDPRALGMAPSVVIRGYDAVNDAAEMLAEAASSKSDFFDDRMLLFSNHSYGTWSGWRNGNWYGPWPATEDPKFGQYNTHAAVYDGVCAAAPYFLPFKSAGNDRNRGNPGSGILYTYFSTSPDGMTRNPVGTANFGVGNVPHPPATDATPDGGYDTLPTKSVCKNVLTLGAASDAVTSGTRDLSISRIMNYSAWGPADDGRIKPDLVAGGFQLVTTDINNTYGIGRGTSIATPTACGSAVLLQNYFSSRSPGNLMRAATLKGLILHTADDFGPAGPDYQSGWGWLNTLRAAEQIKRHLDSPSSGHLLELPMNEGLQSIVPLEWDQESAEIRITLCYTDPAGTAQSGLDSTTRNLVNDLDIVLRGPGGSIDLPFILDPANPTALATTGDNDLDNVEQIIAVAPVPGEYNLQISHEGGLDGGLPQNYSLIISGAGIPPLAPAPTPVIVRRLSPFQENFSSLPLAVDGWSYQSGGGGDGRIGIFDSALRMDNAGDALESVVNAATLHLDLTNQEDVILRFDWSDTNDEEHLMSRTTTGLVEADGVAFSVDGGTTWTRIMSLGTETSDDVRYESVNLTTFMDARGFTDHSDVRVRFQQFGNRASPDDGISFDNVRVYIGNPGTFSFSKRQLTSLANTRVDVSESISEVLVEVQRTGGFDGIAEVDIATLDGSAGSPSDYTARSGILFFGDGVEFRTFAVQITDDGDAEDPETFTLSLSSPSNGSMLGTSTTVTVRVIDNDTPPVTSSSRLALSPVTLPGETAAPQTFEVLNTGGGFLEYQIDTTSVGKWLQVTSQGSGSVLAGESERVTSQVTLDYQSEGLPPGRHAGEVRIIDTGGTNPPFIIPVSLLVGIRQDHVTGHNQVNPTDIPGPLANRADPWPLTFDVFASAGRIVDASYRINTLNLVDPGDVDMVLTSPDGTAVCLMSDVANNRAFETPPSFRSTALIIQRKAQPMSYFGALTLGGIYRPTDFENFPSELPDIDGAPQSWSTELGDFNGLTTGGIWKLWIGDDKFGEDNGGSLGNSTIELTTATIEDVVAERFHSNRPFDLEQQALMFTPAAEIPEGYTVERYALEDFPIPPAGTVLSPPEDSASVVKLGTAVQFYGQEFTKILVFEDGQIGFSPDAGGRISVFDIDIVNDSGAITLNEVDDRVVIIWDNVVVDATGDKISFGAELFYDGRIRLSYPRTGNATPGTVGLARSNQETWSSHYGNLTDIAPVLPPELISFGIFGENGELIITSSSQPDVIYAVEVSEDLDDWKHLAFHEGTGTVLSVTLDTKLTDDRIFYRIRRTSAPVR